MGASETTEKITDLKNIVPLAITEIFNATCQLDLKVVPPDPDINHNGIVIAVISLMGDVDWSVLLGLPRDTATAVAEKFSGFAIPYDSEDMGDAVGELTNIFAGQVKSLLDQQNYRAEISLPSVIRADSMEVLMQRDSAGAKTCFESSVGKLWTGLVMGKSPGFVM